MASILSLLKVSVRSLMVQKWRFENDKYFQETGFLPATEVAHTFMNIRTQIPSL